MIRLTTSLSKDSVKRLGGSENRFHDLAKLRNNKPKQVVRNTPAQFSASPSLSTDTASNPDTYFMLILGKPGGGKGTISKKILEDFPSFRHLSTGDVLRQHVREKTEIGIKAKKHMDEGGLVPNELMIDLVLGDATRELANGNNLLLDGFPRTLEQAAALDEQIEVDLVVDLNVPTETIIERISDRYVVVEVRWSRSTII